MKRTIKTLLTIIITCCASECYAQLAEPPTNVQSPNAASLGQYGQVPVSLFTGVPSIEVPIAQLQEKSISVPISLSYHASGFRPDMHPGWVGVGWNLNAGGAITRTVHGAMDELDWKGLTSYSVPTDRWGFYYNFTDPFINSANWEDRGTQFSLINTSSSYPYKGFRADTQPDEFSFNFAGYSGKFYWSTTDNGSSSGEWRVACDKPIKVEVINAPSLLLNVPFTPPVQSLLTKTKDNAGYPKTFRGFVITGEDGTRYYFGGSESAIEYSMSLFDQNNDIWTANSWYLTKIVDPSDNEINFNYETNNKRFIAQLYTSINFGSSKTKGISQIFSVPRTSCIGGNPVTNTQGATGQLVRPVYLESINTTNESINFITEKSTELSYPSAVFDYYLDRWKEQLSPNYTLGFMPFMEGDKNVTHSPDYQPYVRGNVNSLKGLEWRKLVQINVNTKYSNESKKIALQYNNNYNERLVLKSVTEVGRSLFTVNGIHIETATKNPYVFEYYYPAIFGMQYLAQQSDHWGFYNGKTAILGYESDNFLSYYNSRNPSPDSSIYLSGIIKQIRYPTMGTTKFVFEPHTYSKQVDTTRIASPILPVDLQAGGVRVKEIKSYEYNNKAVIQRKIYNYTVSYRNRVFNEGQELRSSGILGGITQYYDDNYKYEGEFFKKPFVGYVPGYTYVEKVFSSQSVLPGFSAGQGSHIGYSQVTERSADGSYKTHLFSNFDTGNVDDIPPLSSTIQRRRSPYSSYSTREHERGKLLEETAYTKNDKPVRKEQIKYTAFNKDKEYARSVQAGYFNLCPNTASSIEFGVSFRHYTYPYLPTEIITTLYDPTDGSEVKTSKIITYHNITANRNSRLVATETVTDSKNQTLLTTYKYPFTISSRPTFAPSQSSANAVYTMSSRNMVANPIEVAHYTNNLLTDATVQTYNWAGANNAYILPYQQFKFESTLPVASPDNNSVSYGSTASPLILRNGDSRMVRQRTFDSYDTKGNPVRMTEKGNSHSAFLWGYNGNLIAAMAKNALASEVFIEGFEEQATQWDANLTREGIGVVYDGVRYYNRMHTGNQAGRLKSTYYGEQVHSFSSQSATLSKSAVSRKYIISGWVYSEGPQADIWVFKSRKEDLGEDGQILFYNNVVVPTYVDYMRTTTVGKWTYLMKEIEVPADVVKLTLRLTNWARAGNAPGKIWFDDLRIHPAEAQVITYTHQPGVGVTSISDPNNQPVLYEYDGLNRLKLLRDKDRNVVKTYDYRYQQ